MTQQPLQLPLGGSQQPGTPSPASLAFTPAEGGSGTTTNPAPFLLTPALNLPVSFGSAYIGETFSCTLCANNDVAVGEDSAGGDGQHRTIRDVSIEAEMKTPGAARPHKLELAGLDMQTTASTGDETSPKKDLAAGETLQGIVSFDLKEEGNHVLAVTVSYYEVSETSGRTRTFRKLYQFICKPSLIVRTKVTALPATKAADQEAAAKRRKWALEAQLENCSDDVMQLDNVAMDVDQSVLRSSGCNWDASSSSKKPVLHPGEVEQVCFVVQERPSKEDRIKPGPDGRFIFGVLGIGWRGEMGNRGFLTTGKLGTKAF